MTIDLKTERIKEIERPTLYIMITTSLQNDFLEQIDENINEEFEGDLKLNYEDCQKFWIQYFREKSIDVSASNVDDFIKWAKKIVKESTRQELTVSYLKILEKYKHRVHINHEETKRLWDGGFYQFILDLMEKGYKANNNEKSNEEYQFIHQRDWHDSTDLDQKPELDLFGIHCLKGTYGAKFVSPLEESIKKYQDFNLIINSNSLSSFTDTNLSSVLDTLIENAGNSKENVKIGIFGLITNVKIQLLTFELMVIHKFKNVYVCKDFCAGFNKQGHFLGNYYISNILGAAVVDQKQFRKIFNI